eukprot:3850068-Pyramimonas_sp.AAC.1
MAGDGFNNKRLRHHGMNTFFFLSSAFLGSALHHSALAGGARNWRRWRPSRGPSADARNRRRIPT